MTSTLLKNRGLFVAALALAGFMASAVAMPAHADDWHDHEIRAHRYWHPPHPVIVEPAPVVYAPPVVVAPPPPQPLGINLILPLHFN